jgi:hypothetical protein
MGSMHIIDDFSKRPRHDTFIRKAFENPIVAKEFFEMHLPKEIKAMFSSLSYILCKLQRDREKITVKI